MFEYETKKLEAMLHEIKDGTFLVPEAEYLNQTGLVEIFNLHGYQDLEHTGNNTLIFRHASDRFVEVVQSNIENCERVDLKVYDYDREVLLLIIHGCIKPSKEIKNIKLCDALSCFLGL
jgi:hypothetical protein